MVARIELDPTRAHIMHLGEELYKNPPFVFLLRDHIKEDISTFPDKPPKEARPRGSHSSVMLDLGCGSVMSVFNTGDTILIRHFTCTPPPSGDLGSTVGPNGEFASHELVDNDCNLIARVTYITHR